MTIDEAIAKYKEITNTDANCPAHCNISCDKCVQESKQLAEWLEDYKHIKQWKSDIMDSFCKYDVSSFEELIANARNKAIDDFVERLTTYLGIENATKYGNENAEQMRNSYGTFMNYEIAESIKDVAKQLKAGEK